ncbi:MAG TPA: phosphopantetheine-binding protein [Nitriliruptorales bacterium]
MTPQELYGQIETILVETLEVPVADIAPDATYGALGLDSLSVVELILIVEEERSIRIDDEELTDIHTLQQLADVLALKAEAAV